MIRENPITNEEQIIDGRTQKKSSEPVWKDFMWTCIFALCGTIFCMGLNAKEARQEARKAEAVKEAEAEKKKAEKEEKKKEKEAEEQRKKELSVQPGVAVGTTEASDEKIVYLTFDDGPSENTQKVLDILDQYDAKATFLLRGRNRSTVR